MPQATDELRARMKERFGDEIDTTGPMKFLEGAGYTLNPDWTWSKPGVTTLPSDQVTQEEWECILFLFQEWDFGGLVAPQPETAK